MRKLVFHAARIALVPLACTGVTAQTPSLTQSGTDSTAVVVRDVNDPLPPLSITQSTDPNTLVDGTSVGCVDGGGVTTENSWYRLFDLDADHGLVGWYELGSIDWGIQLAQGSLNITLNAYCLDDGLPFLRQFLTLVGTSGRIPVADESLVFHNNSIDGKCDAATQSLVVEIHAEDCNLVGCIVFFVGMNDLGQSAPTYIASESCGIVNPVALAGVGYPDAHLVMVVNYGFTNPPDDGGSVPATTGIGAILLLLFVLGSGAYFLRRRTTG